MPPLYEYETIPSTPDETPVRFEIRHSIKDPALTEHPETGQPVRRLISRRVGAVTGKRGELSGPAIVDPSFHGKGE